MAHQEKSPDAVPHKDRPSPDAERNSTDGRSNARSKVEGDYRGDGPGKVGLISDSQPDLVAPSGVNQRDHGVADDKPMAGGLVNLDDDDMVHPRGKSTAHGGTRDAQGGDSAPLGPPGAGLSDRIGPSDPDSKKQ